MNLGQGHQFGTQGGKVDQQERDIEWSEDLQLFTDPQQCPTGIGVPALRAEREGLRLCGGEAERQLCAQARQAKGGPEACNAFPQSACGLFTLFVLVQRGLFFGREFAS